MTFLVGDEWFQTQRMSRTALAISGFIIVYAFGFGALMHAAFSYFGVTLT